VADGVHGGGDCGCQNSGSRCGLVPSMQSKRRGPDTAADRWAPRGLIFFPNYPKLVEICKIEMDALSCSKNYQILHSPRLKYYEQLSQL
jgi:hypothetical protein